MAVAIFPNSSYFIAFGGSPVFFEEIRLASLRHQARIYACRSQSEFLEALSIVNSPTGLFFDGIDLSEKDLAVCAIESTELKFSPLCLITEKGREDFNANKQARTKVLAKNANSEAWRTAIDEFMMSLVPPKLDQIILDSTNSIVPRFLPGLKTFKSVSYIMEHPDYVLGFSISAGDVIGQFRAWVKWDEICKMLPDLPRNRSGDKVLDLLKESMNTCAGLIVQAILRIHPDCKMRIGLPTGFDLLKVPKIESIKYFPSAHILEEGGRLGISLGFIDLNHRPIFDLSAYSKVEPEGDIEFL